MVSSSSQEIVLVAAVGKTANNSRYVIGSDGKIPWGRIADDRDRLHNDFIHGRPVILGDRTFKGLERVIKNSWPPCHIVVIARGTHTQKDHHGIPISFVSDSLAAVDYFVQAKRQTDVRHIKGIDYSSIMVLGGAVTYESFFSYADRLELTEVAGCFQGDRYFRIPSFGQWQLTLGNGDVSQVPWQMDLASEQQYRFLTYVRRKPF